MYSIDPTEYVEAPEGQRSLKFLNERQQARFELGVTMAIHKWEELNIAVDNSWGGPNSGEKRDWISGVVIDLFDEKAVDIQLIEETLLYAMVDEFDVQVDNDSALEISNIIMKYYKQATAQDYSAIEEAYNKWQVKQQNRQAHRVKVQSDPNNPSDDEDDDEDDEESHEGHNHAHPSQGDDSMDVDNGPIIDEDGFELVQNKKGNRRR